MKIQAIMYSCQCFIRALFIDGVIGRTSNKKLGHLLLYITMTITVIATIILIQIPTATKFFGS
jgi:hypothetical protein